jgi:AcrR family transcriptional regulator
MNATEKKRSDQERVVNRRKQVLDAAECCFSRRGFHGASMSEISKEAGMSAGHIYNYFDSKDDIIAAFVQQNVERVSAKMRGFEQRDDPLQAMFDDIARAVREDLRPGVWKLPLEICAEASRNPAIAELVQAADLQSRTQFAQILRAGRAKRGLTTDEGVLQGRIDVIIAFFQGLHARLVQNPGFDVEATVAGLKLALAPLMFSE